MPPRPSSTLPETRSLHSYRVLGAGFRRNRVIVKVTAKNQLTLPKAMLEAVGKPRYFFAEAKGGTLVLKPVVVVPVEDTDAMLAEVGFTPEVRREAQRIVRERRKRDAAGDGGEGEGSGG